MAALLELVQHEDGSISFVPNAFQAEMDRIFAKVLDGIFRPEPLEVRARAVLWAAPFVLEMAWNDTIASGHVVWLAVVNRLETFRAAQFTSTRTIFSE